jgi:hypothetical protein
MSGKTDGNAYFCNNQRMFIIQDSFLLIAVLPITVHC